MVTYLNTGCAKEKSGKTRFFMFSCKLIIECYKFPCSSHHYCFRYLRCVLPTCQAKGVQEKVNVDSYSNLVSIEKPHNHCRPDANSRKKQMFFFVIRRKLHSDKGLNIKDVYEEISLQ